MGQSHSTARGNTQRPILLADPEVVDWLEDLSDDEFFFALEVLEEKTGSLSQDEVLNLLDGSRFMDDFMHEMEHMSNNYVPPVCDRRMAQEARPHFVYQDCRDRDTGGFSGPSGISAIDPRDRMFPELGHRAGQMDDHRGRYSNYSDDHPPLPMRALGYGSRISTLRDDPPILRSETRGMQARGRGVPPGLDEGSFHNAIIQGYGPRSLSNHRRTPNVRARRQVSTYEREHYPDVDALDSDLRDLRVHDDPLSSNDGPRYHGRQSNTRTSYARAGLLYISSDGEEHEMSDGPIHGGMNATGPCGQSCKEPRYPSSADDSPQPPTRSRRTRAREYTPEDLLSESSIHPQGGRGVREPPLSGLGRRGQTNIQEPPIRPRRRPAAGQPATESEDEEPLRRRGPTNVQEPPPRPRRRAAVHSASEDDDEEPFAPRTKGRGVGLSSGYEEETDSELDGILGPLPRMAGSMRGRGRRGD